MALRFLEVTTTAAPGCHDRHQAVHHHAAIGGLGAFGLGGSSGLLGGQGDGDAALGLGILFTHHALELGG